MLRNKKEQQIWITNSMNNKKIPTLDEIPEGWYKGMTIY
jgi:hypothetical protein